MNRKFSIPVEANKYSGEFIVFYSSSNNPEIIFHSPVAKIAYDYARSIKDESGQNPTVLHVNLGQSSNIQQFISIYA